MQIIVEDHNIRLASSAVSADVEDVWVAHSSCKWDNLDPVANPPQNFDINVIKKRIRTLLTKSFVIDYLAKIGVEGIAFPWQIVEHYGNGKEMIAKVDLNPETKELDWDPMSWAPMLDAATSVGSSIFFSNPKVRIVSRIDRVAFYSSDPLPTVGYLFVEEATDAQSPACHVSILSEQGQLLAKFTSMRFSEVGGSVSAFGNIDSLVHQVAWVPSKLSETPYPLTSVVVISSNK